MTPLDQIRERLNAATPGPWRRVEDVYEPDRWYVEPEIAEVDEAADAEFIAHAHEDVGALLAVAEAAEDVSAFSVLQHDGYYRVDAGEMDRLHAALARFREGEPDA